MTAISAVAVVIALPEGKTRRPSAVSDRAVQPARPDGPKVKLTPELRREINDVLDRFVPAAVRRADVDRAWSLAGPSLRKGWTLRDWRSGLIPVFPFDARGREFHDWRKIYAYRNRVGIDLMLHPKDPTVAAMAVAVDVVRRDGRWLVDGWAPVATFTPPKGKQWTTGVADFGAGGWTVKGREASLAFDEGKLSPVWLLLPTGIIVGSLLALVAVGGIRLVRRNRRVRAIEAELAASRALIDA